MGIQPLAHVTLVGACAGSEFRGGKGTVRGQRAVKPQAVADHHQRRQRRGAEVRDGAAEKAVQCFFIDEGGWLLLHEVLL
jgi:hypothetical protein